jgi:hypothetical protein
MPFRSGSPDGRPPASCDATRCRRNRAPWPVDASCPAVNLTWLVWRLWTKPTRGSLPASRVRRPSCRRRQHPVEKGACHVPPADRLVCAVRARSARCAPRQPPAYARHGMVLVGMYSKRYEFDVTVYRILIWIRIRIRILSNTNTKWVFWNSDSHLIIYSIYSIDHNEYRFRLSMIL